MALHLRVKTIAASGLALLFLRAAQAARISNINVNSASAGGKPVLHPIIIMGPLLGQTLMVKDTRLLNWCGGVFSSYDEVWIGDKSNLVLCGLGAKQLHLKFDPRTNQSSPLQPGVHVKVADSWNGLSLMGKDVYASVTNRLEREGYKMDVDMIAHPYDWRLGVADWRVDSFPELKEKIEDAVHFTGKRIVMTGISMAGPFTHAFLTWVREYGGTDWPSKYVHAWVPIGAPWNGAVNALSAVLNSALTAWATPTHTFSNASFSCPDCIPKISGDAPPSGFGLFHGILKELDVYLENTVQDKLTELVRSMPSVYWLSTNLDYSTTPPTDKTYVELAHKLVLSEGAGIEPVKASEMPKLFRKGGLVEEAQMLEYGMSVGTTTDPGVPVHCVYSTNVRTFQRIRIPVTFPLDLLHGVEVELGDGDGTVHLDSLNVCDRWSSTKKTYRIPGVNHIGTIQVREVIDILVAVATEDQAFLDAWKPPSFEDLELLEGNVTEMRSGYKANFLRA